MSWQIEFDAKMVYGKLRGYPPEQIVEVTERVREALLTNCTRGTFGTGTNSTRRFYKDGFRYNGKWLALSFTYTVDEKAQMISVSAVGMTN